MLSPPVTTAVLESALVKTTLKIMQLEETLQLIDQDNKRMKEKLVQHELYFIAIGEVLNFQGHPGNYADVIKNRLEEAGEGK